MGKVLDRLREKRANNSVITAEDSSFQVGNENPQEAHVVSNTGKQEVKANNPPKNEEEATSNQEVKPINTEAIKIDMPHIDLSYKDNPSIANNKNGDADIAEYYNDQVEGVANQKDFFGVVQPVAQNNVETQATEETPQTNASVQGNGTPTAEDIIKGTWQKPDASHLTIVNDMKQANTGVEVPKIENNAPTEKMVKENPLAIGLEAYTMNQVIDKAKTMEGGLSKEGNIEKAMKELGVDNMRFDLDTIDNTYNGETITPKTQEAETPQATQEEEETKLYGDDWLYEFSKINPKPNVLADLGFHGFEKYSVPDNLLKLWGKDFNAAVDSITDENGNHLTDEQKKRIKRRIRGVRAGQALMQIANIATQAAAVSQGGTPVKMDNSSILGKIHNQAQAKQDAWLKQALKAKETANKDKMDMLNYQLDWMKYQNDLQGKINDANIKKAQLALDAEKAEIDRQYKEKLLNNAQYRAETARIKANKEAVENGDENAIKEINANAKLRDDFKIIKTKDGTVVIPYANLEQIYSELSKLEPNNQGDGETSKESNPYRISLGDNTEDVKTKLLGAVTSLINKHGYDKIKKYMVNDKATAERVLKAYGRGNKIYFNTGD